MSERVKFLRRPLWALVFGSFLLAKGLADLFSILFFHSMSGQVVFASVSGIIFLLAGIFIMSENKKNRWIGLGFFIVTDLMIGVASHFQTKRAREVVLQSESVIVQGKKLISKYGARVN